VYNLIHILYIYIYRQIVRISNVYRTVCEKNIRLEFLNNLLK